MQNPSFLEFVAKMRQALTHARLLHAQSHIVQQLVIVYLCTCAESIVEYCSVKYTQNKGRRSAHGDNNNTHIVAIAPPPLFTSPQSWAKLQHIRQFLYIVI